MSKDVQSTFMEILVTHHGPQEAEEVFRCLVDEKRYVVEAWT